MLMSLTLPAPAAALRARLLWTRKWDPRPRGTMPRSFLVKTHSSHRIPNYGELETQRGRGCRAPPPPPRARVPRGRRGRLLEPVTSVPGRRRGGSSPARLGLSPGLEAGRWSESGGARGDSLSTWRSLQAPNHSGLSPYGLARPSQLRETKAIFLGHELWERSRGGGKRPRGPPGAAIQGLPRNILDWVVATGSRKIAPGLHGASAQLAQRSKGPSSASSPLLGVSLWHLLTPVEVPRAGWAKGLQSSPRGGGGGSVGRWESRTQNCPLIPIPYCPWGQREVPGRRPLEWLELSPLTQQLLGAKTLLGDC